MKYIRTSRGFIIQKTNFYKVRKNHLCEQQECGYFDCGEIVAQADTIEELCDGYFCFTKSGKNWIITENYETAKLYVERGCKVNGCILTDKGLIYVAKMNEKGELELL